VNLTARSLLCIVALAFGSTLTAVAQEGTAAKPAGVPEGPGLSAKYPGDVGIEKDPAVLIFEGFEDTPKKVDWMQEGGWFGGGAFGPETSQFLTDKDPAAGKSCVEYHLKKGEKSAAGSGMFHKIPPQDTVYIRTYRKFEEGWEWPVGYGPHDLGIHGYLGEFSDGPTSTDLHLLLDFWMTGDTILRVGGAKHEIKDWGAFIRENYGPVPVGSGGFPWNVSKPDKIVPGKWHCAEIMVKLSTPGKRDGIARLWVNGKLVSNFTDVPLRDAQHADMKLSLLLYSHYFHPGSPKDQVHWADQLVVAKEYIGPVAPLAGE
jgi:hypothetical protein